MSDTPTQLARARGRPRKFASPSRHVTLTLPEHVIEALTRIDADLSRAIVRVAERPGQAPARPVAELARFGRRAVIVVNRSRTLERRAGVDLVPLPDGRALIAFDRARTTADVELTIADVLEDPSLEPQDRAIFEAITKILKDARRSEAIVVRQRNIIVLEAQPRRAPQPARNVSRRVRRT